MEGWKKSSCSLCSSTCGLEIKVENNHIERVRGDKDNPRTRGYLCRKARGIQYFQHQPDRLLYPLKKVGEGQYERISWRQAFEEITQRVKEIVAEHGPESFACQGLGGFLGQLHTLMAKQFLAAVGSQYHFRALAAELTGYYWSCGKMLGNQTFILHPDEEESDVLCVCGWNTYVTHNMVKSRHIIKEFSTRPDKLLIVMDPRRSETARMADIHLAIRPGTDALLWRAMVALLLREGWHNKAFIEAHISDFDRILPWFEGVDIEECCRVCDLAYEDVYKVTQLLATRKSSLHSDLGIICGRHSTLTTHIQNVFLALCGNLLTPGGNCFMTALIPGANTLTDDPKYWRTNATGFPPIFGLYPTAVLGAEIDNDSTGRIRALICCNSNPLRSIVDTKAQEKALKRLDLLVNIDCTMTETALIADYILPNSTAFECYELNSMSKSYPEIYHHLRQPIIRPEGEIMTGAALWLELVKAYGVLPQLPQSLYEAAEGDRKAYAACLQAFLAEHPELQKFRLAIVGETLGRALGSVELAAYWSLLQTAPERFRTQAVAAGFPKGPDQLEQIFEGVLSHPEGLCIGKMDQEHLFELLETADKKIHVHAAELDDWIREITPELEEAALCDPEFPLVLNAGRHIETNINHTMRDPAWIMGKENPCVLTIHPQDAAQLHIADGQLVRVTTRVGVLELPARIHRETRPGSVMMPHGFGFIVQGKPSLGVNVNELTDEKDIDRLAGTPYHRYVPCRVAPV